MKIKTLTIKNFMSVGNVPATISFNQHGVTMVVGENRDLGGNAAGSKNGVGKSTIANALSYVLYGDAITKIKMDNLINRTNQKNMLVTVEFEKDGITYRIERGRKPNVLAFYDVSNKPDTSDSQGDNKDTQNAIVKVLGLSRTMFNHIMTLTTYTEPFLKMEAADQRETIEELLSISILSDKAETLKEQIKTTKDTIKSEEFRLNAITEANKRVQEQINSVKKRASEWETAHDTKLSTIASKLEGLYNIDITDEIKKHTDIEQIKETEKAIRDLKIEVKRLSDDKTRLLRDITTTTTEINALKSHKCHACGQTLHDTDVSDTILKKTETLAKYQESLDVLTSELNSLDEALNSIPTPASVPTTFYKTVKEAHDHQTQIKLLEQQLETVAMETNPYTSQATELETNTIVEPDYTAINEATSLRDHQEFLLKLLTNKDSFIRKKIIDQNLGYLNQRLDFYLSELGSPHNVVFMNDLTVDIEEMGRSMDYGNLSRGEATRVNIALSLAFLDVWESSNEAANLLLMDEVLDAGMDQAGADAAVGILKWFGSNRDKNTWLITHKEELTIRADNIFKVVKEKGFTTFA